jgi:hypothetical protein
VETGVVLAGSRRDALPRAEIEQPITGQDMIGRGISRGYHGATHRWDHPTPASRVVPFPVMPQTGS